MNKIIVLSDSHGNIQMLKNAINFTDFDSVIYLGDGLRDLEQIKVDKPIYKVCGNCDIFADEPLQDFIKIENVKILFTHGHIYSVKAGIWSLKNYAKQNGYNLVFYGHTHQECYQKEDGIVFINPGSISVGRMAIVTIDNGKIDCKQVDLRRD